MSRIDIMTDIETLGVHTDSHIIQISALAFDINTGEEKNKFDECVDITKSDYMNVDGSTLSWWLDTDKDLLSDIIKRGKDGYDLENVIGMFEDWFNLISQDYDEIYLWGNGILFDNKMIQAQFERFNLKYPIFYRNDRDMRTIVELAQVKEGLSSDEFKAKFEDDSFKKHDAFDDCRWQINVVNYCWNLLTK